MGITAVITAARSAAGLSQLALARSAGTSQPTVSQYESGSKVPTADTLERLLAAAGVVLIARAVTHRPAPPARLARAGRALEDVLDLADALPSRPSPELLFPRLVA